MNPGDLSGKLSALLVTPRSAPQEAALQASLGMPHSPVASRLGRVDKLGESSLTRQAIDAPNPPVTGTPPEADTADLRSHESVLTHLSKTAGFLASLMGDRSQHGPSRASLAAGGAVLDAPPHYPAPLALGLQALLQDSGLFYESHLRDWYQGQYPRERLQREPQARWIPSSSAGDASTMPEAAARLSPGAGEAAGDARLPMPAIDGSPAGRDAALADMPNEAAKMITQQLLLLDKPSLACSVDVWPGQRAHFLIEEESPRSAEAAAVWRTRIELDFPQLGHMDIALSLEGTNLRIHLDAENGGALAPLRQHQAWCAERLGSTGCRLHEFTIGSRDGDD